MKIVLITRTWNDFKIKDFIKKLPSCLDRIIVLVNSEKEKHNYTQSLLLKLEDKILKKLDILHVEPWNDPSGVLNIGIEKAFEYKAKQIIIISKEIEISKEEIRKMSEELAKNKKRLVVGYAIKTPKSFEKEHRGHCKDCNSDVLRIPWNTCAMWNAKLFLENVGAFHPVCDCTGYLGKAVLTEKQKKLVGKEEIELKGMEDALAMALAIKRNPKLRLGIWLKKPLEWKVKEGKEAEHIEKMIRKVLVYKKYHEIFDSLPRLKNHIDNLS